MRYYTVRALQSDCCFALTFMPWPMTDKHQTPRFHIFYRISNHKNFFPKYLDNALTDFA